MKTARSAAINGAFELAGAYLDRVTEIWPYDKEEMWREDRELSFDLVTTAGEVTLGSKTVRRHTDRVSLDFTRRLKTRVC